MKGNLYTRDLNWASQKRATLVGMYLITAKILSNRGFCRS